MRWLKGADIQIFDSKQKLYRTNILLNRYANVMNKVTVQVSPNSSVPSNVFHIGFGDLTQWCTLKKLTTNIGSNERWFPIFESMYSETWRVLYTVNGVCVLDKDLEKVYEDLDWDLVETITTPAFLKAKGDVDIRVLDLESEYIMVCLNQYYSAGGILAKILRAVSSISDTIIETGTGYGVFARALIAGRPKSFTTCDPKKWLDGPDKLAKICEAEGIKFKFVHNRSIDWTPEKPVDTIFFDGNHTYDYLKEELKHLEPYAKKFMIFHDVESPPVGQAINDYFINRSEWKQVLYDRRAEGMLVLAHGSQFIDKEV